MRETVIEKDFAPISGGEHVGWVAVNQHNLELAYVTVDIATATVGKDGAVLSHDVNIDPVSGETLRLQTWDEGFFAVSALQVTLSKDDSTKDHLNVLFRTDSPKDRGNDLLRTGADGVPAPNSEHSGKQWASNANELIEIVKSKLARFDLADRYPMIYYQLNTRLAHDSVISGRRDRQLKPLDLVYPDPEMFQVTQEQISIARSIVIEFQAAVAEDEKMQKRLTVFSDVKANEIPERFVESRRKISSHERSILQSRGNLHAHNIVYVPDGFRPDGRTWPYMNASESNETTAFGKELQGLKNKKVNPAQSELDREISELYKRWEFARLGHKALHVLGEAEKLANYHRVIEK